MEANNYRIVPFTEDYLPGATDLERGILQGRNVQLELVKEHFLDRARVFEKWHCCLAVSNDGYIIGTVIGARTKLIVNGDMLDVGIGFDAKTHPDWRHKGVGRMLAKGMYQQFFKPEGLTRNIMTAKKSNAPMLNLVSRTILNVWRYDFVYLTVPTAARIESRVYTGQPVQRFSVGLFDQERIAPAYYSQPGDGPRFFRTNKMYQLRVKKISLLYKSGIAVLKWLRPARFAGLPQEEDVLSLATLYDHASENIDSVNEILEHLQREGIGQLLVCCRKNDTMYKTFRNKAIHEYGYYLVSDFKLDRDDQVVIDVRCL